MITGKVNTNQEAILRLKFVTPMGMNTNATLLWTPASMAGFLCRPILLRPSV